MIYNFKLIKKNLKYNKVKDQWEFNGPYPIIFVNTHIGKHPVWSKRRILDFITFMIRFDYKEDYSDEELNEQIKRYIL